MEDSKAESFLYIETFETEITRLCDPYTHPTYLSLLGDFENRLLEELGEALNKAIDDTLSLKDQSSSNDKGNASEQIINLKKGLKDKITPILGEKQKDSSKDAIPSLEDPTTLEKALLTTLTDSLTSTENPLESIEKEYVEKLKENLEGCFNGYKEKDEKLRKGIIRSIINREVEVIGETPEKGETNKDEQNANQKDKIKQEQSGNGEIAEGKEESKENEQESKQSHWLSFFSKETKRTLERRCAQLDKIIEDL